MVKLENDPKLLNALIKEGLEFWNDEDIIEVDDETWKLMEQIFDPAKLINFVIKYGMNNSHDSIMSADEYDEVVEGDELVFTESSLLDLLINIEELKQYDIGLTETVDGTPLLQIGESTYELTQKEEIIIDVDEDVVDEISEINEETYTEIANDNELIEEDVDIESGLVKEAIKTLAIGGLVRLGKKFLES